MPLAAEVVAAEAKLDPALVAKFSTFDGVVMMDGGGHHPPADGHGDGQQTAELLGGATGAATHRALDPAASRRPLASCDMVFGGETTSALRSKRERGRAASPEAPTAPATVMRRATFRRCHWTPFRRRRSGKAEGGGDPRVRRPAMCVC